ncbi:hypothetical protein IQ268_25680 [Oculatella sp. LEGE 06141]|uniref:hypothetical protein n=1 Tax=Oculatella sp. LEGE 06141 TaxID=1828648 RepID=UPI00188059DD|nr:hypothetical protein [Oculatella sp. LEGE 06141]MBE9181964.1 hypothetical protein [Oculatella sp. LEGE 06141]
MSTIWLPQDDAIALWPVANHPTVCLYQRHVYASAFAYRVHQPTPLARTTSAVVNRSVHTG